MAADSKGVSIPIVADASGFAKAVRTGMVDPIEDVEKALERTDRAGDMRSTEAGMRDAADATERVRSELDDVIDKLRQTEKRGKDAGDGIGKGVGDGARKASEDVEEFNRETRQNLSETLSSFDGSFESVVDGVQGTLGGVVGGLTGPMGLFAAAAGAAGIGLIVTSLENAKAEAQASREAAAELADAYIEAGGAIATAEYGVDRLRELATVAEEGEDSLVSLKKEADSAGVSWRDYTDALVGSEQQQRELWREVERGIKVTEGELDQARKLHGAHSEEARALEDRMLAQRRLQGEVGKQIGITENATLAQELYTEAAADYTAEVDAQARAEENRTKRLEEAATARTDAASALQGEIDEAVSGFAEFTESEDQAMDPAGYIDAMRQRREATGNFAENVAQLATEFGLSHEEQQRILDQGLEFAPLLQSIIDSGMSEEYAREVQAGVDAGERIVNGTDLSTTIRMDVNDKPFREWVRGQGPIRIDVEPNPSQRFADFYAAPGRLNRP